MQRWSLAIQKSVTNDRYYRLQNVYISTVGTKGKLISKANYDVFDSSKKRMKHTQDSILSVFRSFFGRIRDFIICFRDLLTFRYHNGILPHTNKILDYSHIEI